MTLYRSKAPEAGDLSEVIRIRQIYDSFSYGVAIISPNESSGVSVYVRTEANKIDADLRRARRNTGRIGKDLEGRSD